MQILGSGESTTKKKASSKSLSRVLEALCRYSEAGKVPLKKSIIEESSRALRRYSEAEKVPLTKKASSKSPTRVLEVLRRYSKAGKVRPK